MTALAERAIKARRRLLGAALQKKRPINDLHLSEHSFEAEVVSFVEDIPIGQEVKWSPADQLLVDWFMSETCLPCSPFSFGQGVFVESPQRFYEALKTDIAAGSKGCRSFFGALQNDLQKLKNIVDQKC